MPYSHSTFADLKTALAGRLGDPNMSFWTSTELGLYITEALRTFGILSGFWRERVTLPLSTAVAFYDIPSLAAPAGVIDSTVTDRDLILQLQYALLESTSSQSSWTGTDQFTYDDITSAITRRRNQFLVDTGLILTHSTQVCIAPPNGRQPLTDTIMDLRRVSWLDSTTNYYSQMWRNDERALVTANPNWSLNSGTPSAYSVMAPPPLEVQLAPTPINAGTLDMLTCSTGPTLDPATLATSLGIPDDLTPAIKWGALADLLGIDGQSRDPARADYCESRYQQFVELGRMLALVINAEIDGVPTIPTTLDELDSAMPEWQNTTGQPAYSALAGWSMLAVYPLPLSSNYSLTLDLVRKAPIPVNPGDYIQLGREQMDMLLDYAEHLSLFKCAGAEFMVTDRQATNFLTQSITYNQRLGASARYLFTPKQDSQRNNFRHPRRLQADGLGALPSVQEVQPYVPTNASTRVKERQI